MILPRSSEMKEIGVAIIGTGFMAAVHAEALRRVGVTITGILGSTPARGVAAAARLELPRGYENLDELLHDPAVHAVHVNTPNRFHLPQCTAALNAGKHVLCEKPLAMDSRESAELVKLAARHPRQVSGVNYNVRFYPLCHEARAMIRRGDIGRIFHITGSVAQDWLLRDTDYNWRVLAEQGGELRALSDIGSHWLDLIHFVTGLEPQAVLADYVTVHPKRLRPRGEIETFSNATGVDTASDPVDVTTDDYGAVLVRFTDGSRANLWVSQVSAGRKYCIRFEIAGQLQTLAWNSEDCEKLWIGRRDGPNSLMMRDPSHLSPGAKAVTDYPGGHDEGYPDSFKQCFRSFYNYILARDYTARPSFATFADGHRDMVLCDAFVASAARGAWVDLSALTPTNQEAPR
jgi:predicted dehydrogenase